MRVAKTTGEPDDVPGLHHAGGEPHLLREIMRTHQALVSVFTRKVGVPGARLVLLRVLAKCHPDAVGIVDLARRLGVNAAAVTRQVKDLEEKGMVARSHDNHDRRRSLVKLTSKGLRTFRQIHERSHEFERSLGAKVAAKDMATAARVLAEVRTALEGLR